MKPIRWLIWRSGHAGTSCAAGVTSPACSSIRCTRIAIRIPARPADSSLIDSGRRAHFDRAAYTEWLQQLRAVCDERGIVLIFDEVFVGFRLAPGGAQRIFRRPARPHHLWQDAGRWSAGWRDSVARQRADEALPRRSAGRYLLCARHVQRPPLCHGGDVGVSTASPRGAVDRRRCTRASTNVWNDRAAQSQRPSAAPRISRSAWPICLRSGRSSYTQPVTL